MYNERDTVKARLWLALSLTLFSLTTYNDSKFTLPIIVWTFAGVLLGNIFDKLICIPVFFSWAYLWFAVFSEKVFSRKVIWPFIIILIASIVHQFVICLSSQSPDVIGRNHWLLVVGSLFILSSIGFFIELYFLNRDKI
jgi:hypothetical protein